MTPTSTSTLKPFSFPPQQRSFSAALLVGSAPCRQPSFSVALLLGSPPSRRAPSQQPSFSVALLLGLRPTRFALRRDAPLPAVSARPWPAHQRSVQTRPIARPSTCLRNPLYSSSRSGRTRAPIPAHSSRARSEATSGSGVLVLSLGGLLGGSFAAAHGVAT